MTAAGTQDVKFAYHRLGNWCGVLAPLLWATAIILCGSLRPGYSHLTQYISELGERGSSTELVMRYGGFVPTGLMHVAFAAYLHFAFKGHRLAAIAAALLALNGIARVGAGMFPCEVGCAGPGLITEKLHSFSAVAGFFSIIGASMIWGILLKRIPGFRLLGFYSIASGLVAFVFLLIMSLNAEPKTATGLYERLSSGVLSLWVLVFALSSWRRQ